MNGISLRGFASMGLSVSLLWPSVGCTEVFAPPVAAASVGTDSNTEAKTAEETAETAEDLAQQSLQQRIGKLFSSVYETIDKTRSLVDKHESLPDRTYNPFGDDKQSNRAAMNALLDEAITMLQVSGVSESRQQLQKLQTDIQDAHQKIAEYRRKRLSAPEEKNLGRVDKVNPFVTTQEAYDEMIAAEQAQIKVFEQAIKDLKVQFAKDLQAIGLNVGEDGADTLLASVSGDDLVSMAIVFDNIKHLTVQLQQLTVDSGEALDEAKRYYGMYFVLVKVIDRIQKSFIEEIDAVHIPKLNEYMNQANENIAQAEALIKAKGGDPQILKANISSNELTKKTADMYVTYLKENAKLIAQENREVEKTLATAMNTYKTVKLSSDVAALMRTGRKNFDTLMKLRVPAMHEFENDSIRREFAKMTEELRAR